MADTAKTERLFTKEQLAGDEHFSDYRDIIYAIMSEEEKCSVKGIDKKINAFLSKKIN